MDNALVPDHQSEVTRLDEILLLPWCVLLIPGRGSGLLGLRSEGDELAVKAAALD